MHHERTHRVDLGWFLERINLDSSISIRHVGTTEQLADIQGHRHLRLERK